MLISRRSLLNGVIAGWAATNEDQVGTEIVIRLKDRKVLHLKNRDFAARAVLPPASTIKPFAIVALLESGKLGSNDLFYCDRRLQIGRHSLNCIHPATGIPMNAARALAYSCNGAIAHFAKRFGADEFAQSLIRYGFTSSSGLIKGDEAAGRVSRGGVGDACELQALGEDGVMVTPAELLLAYSRMAGRMKDPRFSMVLEGLEGVVRYGTGQAAQLKGATVAGKTGSILLRSGMPAAWFAGFAPSRDPMIAVVILKPGYSGGLDAAPVAGALLKSYLDMA